MAKQKLSPLALVLIGGTHLAITSVTWHDLKNRPADEVRGSKKLWRIFSGANTVGSLAYLLIGRRAHPAR
jgi:hypothetical protein